MTFPEPDATLPELVEGAIWRALRQAQRTCFETFRGSVDKTFPEPFDETFPVAYKTFPELVEGPIGVSTA